MKELAKYNNNYGYLLCCLDCFSRRAVVVPQRTKTGKETAESFEKIFKKFKATPKNLHVDEGKQGIITIKNHLNIFIPSHFL